MATAFPTSLDNFSNPASSTAMDGGGNAALSHAVQHSNINDAIEAVEAAVGVTNSTDPNSIQNKLTTKADASHTHVLADIADYVPPSGPSGVTAFNTRTGAVTLSSSDVTTALGYTPTGPGISTLGGVVARGMGLTYVAATDGFVFGSIYNGGVGEDTMLVYRNGINLLNAGFQGSGAFCYPIKAGDTYQALTTGYIYWTSLN